MQVDVPTAQLLVPPVPQSFETVGKKKSKSLHCHLKKKEGRVTLTSTGRPAAIIPCITRASVSPRTGIGTGGIGAAWAGGARVAWGGAGSSNPTSGASTRVLSLTPSSGSTCSMRTTGGANASIFKKHQRNVEDKRKINK